MLHEGFAAEVLGKGPEAERHRWMLTLANQRVAEAMVTLKADEAGAATDKDGHALVRCGLAYFGLGQHDKGIALISAGQKARAAQAFKAVTGTDGMADLARLWLKVH